MKSLLKLACLYFAAAGTALAAAPITITFDDLPNPGYGQATLIPSGYAGLQWSGLLYANAYNQPLSSYFGNGVVSSPNVAISPYSSTIGGAVFNFNSVYLTAFNQQGSQQQVEVQMWTPTTLAYDITYTLSTAHSTLIYGSSGVDQVIFNSTGTFIMDNLSVTIIPEPSFPALLGVGAFLMLFSCERFGAARKTTFCSPAQRSVHEGVGP